MSTGPNVDEGENGSLDHVFPSFVRHDPHQIALLSLVENDQFPGLEIQVWFPLTERPSNQSGFQEIRRRAKEKGAEAPILFFV